LIYNNPDDHISEYEETINKLTNQITELFSKIHFYQALIAEKEHEVSKLTNENIQLKTQIQNLTYELKRSAPSRQDSYIPLPAPTPRKTTRTILLEQSNPKFTDNPNNRVNKRQCPNCGAMGFAIREIEDKSNVISYIPRRIYAKKKSCTKCSYEW